MITAVILNLHLVKADLTQSALWDRLAELGLPADLGLSALAGLALGLSLVERANRRFVSVLLSQTRRYQNALSELSASKKKLLADFVRDVVEAMGT
jgi:hypothetical protein